MNFVLVLDHFPLLFLTNCFIFRKSGHITNHRMLHHFIILCTVSFLMYLHRINTLVFINKQRFVFSKRDYTHSSVGILPRHTHLHPNANSRIRLRLLNKQQEKQPTRQIQKILEKFNVKRIINNSRLKF